MNLKRWRNCILPAIGVGRQAPRSDAKMAGVCFSTRVGWPTEHHAA